MSASYTKLSTLQPFLIKAFYNWSVEQNLTAQILVHLDGTSEIKIPKQFLTANEGSIIFNISPRSVTDLEINNKSILFKALFNKVSYHISIPIHLIELIYIKENIHIGMSFDCGEDEQINPFLTQSEMQDGSGSKFKEEKVELFDFANKEHLETTLSQLNQSLSEINSKQNSEHPKKLEPQLLKQVHKSNIKLIFS